MQVDIPVVTARLVSGVCVCVCVLECVYEREC